MAKTKVTIKGAEGFDTWIEGTVVTITFDTAKTLHKSKSRKSDTVAGSVGNKTIPGLPEEVKIGLNVYK